LPIIVYADGHGFEFTLLFSLAIKTELLTEVRFPGAILVVLSLDAKFFLAHYYTQVSLR